MLGFKYSLDLLRRLKYALALKIYHLYCKFVKQEVPSPEIFHESPSNPSLSLVLPISVLFGILLLLCLYCVWNVQKNVASITKLTETVNHLLAHKESVTTTLLAVIEKQEIQDHYRTMPPSEPMYPFEPLLTDAADDEARSCVSRMSFKSNLTLPLRSNRAERLRLAAGHRKKGLPHFPQKTR